MEKLRRYDSFEELKASKDADEPSNNAREVKPSELEDFFKLLRDNEVTAESVIHESQSR